LISTSQAYAIECRDRGTKVKGRLPEKRSIRHAIPECLFIADRQI
jgi:hypothetical protein